MKSLFAIAIVAFIGFVGFIQTTSAMEMDTKNQPRLIMFHADTCGNCKILAPKLEEALKAVGEDKIEIVKFDYTSRDTILKSKDLAAEKGLTDIQKHYGAKTGFAVIVNDNGEQTHMISSKDDVATIEATLNEALS